MLTDSNKGIQAMILEHIMHIHDMTLFYDPEYKQLGRRPDELLKQVKEKLNPEDQKLLFEYDEEWIKQINRQDEVIYTQALMRGIAIGYWTALIGNGLGEIEV
ncbi:MAG: hypothetical protein GXY86_13230 [Firmicutes bacterium]|nr:hypothetical protein [Bacillota bacterium]